MIHGHDPPPLLSYEGGSSVFSEVDQQLINRDAVLTELRQQFHRAQHRMKNQADKKCCDITSKVGDLVFLKLQPYRQNSLAHRANEKLSSRFYGPFKDLNKVGIVAYRLELPVGAKIHPMFHVSQLKRVVGSFPPLPPLPPHLSDDMEMVVELVEVLGTKPSSGSNKHDIEFLIKWKGLLHRNTLL